MEPPVGTAAICSAKILRRCLGGWSGPPKYISTEDLFSNFRLCSNEQLVLVNKMFGYSDRPGFIDPNGFSFDTTGSGFRSGTRLRLGQRHIACQNVGSARMKHLINK
jgi:hypothetical protein